jgi:hypothetical protein
VNVLRRCAFVLTAIATVMGSGTSLQAASVSLAWTPPVSNVNGTPLTNLRGFKVHYGRQSGSYSTSVDVGNTTNITVAGLDNNATYFFSVTAYNSSNVQSAYAAELVWNSPDTLAPEIVSVFSASSGSVQVVFNEALNSNSAVALANYRIVPATAISRATLSADRTSVALQTAQLVADTSYTLTVSNVTDLSGNGIAPNTQRSLSFTHDVLNGLVSRWTFDEGAGATAGDAAGTNVATLSGAEWAAGRSGAGISLDASGDAVNAGTFDPSAADLTLTAWVNWRGPSGGYEVIMAKRDSWSAADMRWQFYRHIDGKLRFERQGAVSTFGIGLPTTNQWCHLAVTKTGSNVLLYINGTPAATTSMSLGSDSAARVVLGNAQVGGAETFNGAMDEVRVYNRALTAAEIGTIYAAHGSEPALDGDADALPDAWEVASFGNIGVSAGRRTDDVDRDGIADADEYQSGTNPNNALDYARLEATRANGQFALVFNARAAEGPGYSGVRRHYAIERSPMPAGSGAFSWTTVAGYTDLLATNQAVTCLPPINSSDRSMTYRLKTWLD